MKKYIMVAVLGIIALVLTFSLMPAATTAPSTQAEEGAGGGMPIGTEVTLDNDVVATYLGETPAGNYEWQATFTTSSSDGEAHWGPGRPYSFIWSASTGDTYQSNDSYFAIGQTCIYGDEWRVMRGFVFFPDTVSLPSDATITNAALLLYAYDDFSVTDFDIVVQSGMLTYPHDPLIDGDYDKRYYNGDGGSYNTVKFPAHGTMQFEITLNVDGRSWINKDGCTKFALRSREDIAGSAPTDHEYVEVRSYEYGAGYRPQLVVNYVTPPPPLSLLGKYAPVLYFYPSESYYTNPISSMLEQSDLKNIDSTFSLTNPTTDQLSTHNTTKYYMDMRNAEPTPTPVFPNPDRFAGYPLTVYGRQAEVDNYIVLQYWFFYPYNLWINCHEGDWERIQIICDKEGNPINVTFGQHLGGKTVAWKGDVSLVEGTHPKVFAALGSHASYPTDGPHPVLIFTDLTLGTGIVSFPSYINSSGHSYTLVDISSEPSWVKWLGKWGQYAGGVGGLLGQCGPDSPANVVINDINVWNDPIAWADDPGPPAIVAQATGPVRLHAYSNGNHTGLNETGAIEAQIPGTYFYVPASNQSDAEIIWVYTKENLTFKLEATGLGECNFTIAKCQSDEVTTNYTHIQVTENTTVTVSSAQAPFSAMQIDHDGDGFSDETRFPDAMGNSTLIGHVSFTGRGPAPNAKWIETLEVRFFDNATKLEMYWSPVNATTNSSGYFKITHLPASTTI